MSEKINSVVFVSGMVFLVIVWLGMAGIALFIITHDNATPFPSYITTWSARAAILRQKLPEHKDEIDKIAQNGFTDYEIKIILQLERKANAIALLKK